MTSHEIRQQFLDFFKSKNHRIVSSSPVVPFDDPTLLFTNAGMNQFKDVFLGTGTREYKRAADTQKCIRVSGKHNDLEEVGHDTYHHTLFEMLGNWSFGDYYKKEAIGWAWELLTEVWKLPKERLWATVYKDDNEALELWKSETDIKTEHILKFAEKDNFWEMGETGPCGPCSEIHINVGDDFDNPKYVNAGSPECIEIWNLVFIQYNRDETGKLNELPAKHVDTGMGFERVCAVLQQKKSNYETDVFSPLIQKISKISGIEYYTTLPAENSKQAEDHNISMRVIADHIRALSFAIGDGAVPGNEGRGYVLRRILRRAARYGRKLNLNEPFLYKLVDVLSETIGDVFPELVKNKQNIKKIIKAEEESFNTTLDRGIALFDAIAEEVTNFDLNSIIKELKKLQNHVNDLMDVELKEKVNRLIDQRENLTNENALSEIDSILSHSQEDKLSILTAELAKLRKKHQKYITGEDIFKLYDTFGFPDDLLNVMAQEKGLKLDVERFQQLMNEQKDRARSSTKRKLADIAVQVSTLNGFELLDGLPTTFVGYDQLIIGAQIVGYKNENGLSFLIFNRTPFYVEAGGQIDDIGVFAISDELFEIVDVTKVDNRIIHILKNEQHFQFQTGMDGLLSISENRRWDIMRNHSATHFLHAALRETLGTHVQQAGSYVGPDRLRFDFTHFSKLTQDEVQAIENIVNEQVRKNIPLQHHRSIPFDDAKKMGALMFFGDKYGDNVNVVQFGDYTMEFCGGTHVHNSSEIGLFKIISESSIASGIRRIEAVTGAGVEKYITQQHEQIKSNEQKIEELLDAKKKLEKEIAELKTKEKLEQLDHILSLSSEENEIKIYKGRVHVDNMDELKSFGDEMRNRMGSGIGVLISQIDDKVGIVAVVSDDVIKNNKLSAGKIVGELAKLVGGGGGGRPHLATAGGKDVGQIVTALSKVEKIVSNFI